MIKELEALDDWLWGMINSDEIDMSDLEYFKKLRMAILELQDIKEANPSEALECLESLRQECKSTYFDENRKQWWTTDKNKDYRCNNIKQALLKAQKFDDILKKYNVDDVEELDDILSNYRKHYYS